MVVAQLLEPDTNQLKEKDHCIASLHINWIWPNTKNCWNQTNQTIYQLNSDTTVLFNIRGPKFWTNCIYRKENDARNGIFKMKGRPNTDIRVDLLLYHEIISSVTT